MTDLEMRRAAALAKYNVQEGVLRIARKGMDDAREESKRAQATAEANPTQANVLRAEGYAKLADAAWFVYNDAQTAWHRRWNEFVALDDELIEQNKKAS